MLRVRTVAGETIDEGKEAHCRLSSIIFIAITLRLNYFDVHMFLRLSMEVRSWQIRLHTRQCTRQTPANPALSEKQLKSRSVR